MKEFENDNLDMNYISYYIMIQALKDININEGLAKALYLLKLYIKSEDIILFRADEHEQYNHYSNNVMMNNNSKTISLILNQGKSFIEKKDYFNFDIKIKGKLYNFIFIPIKFKNSKYIISIINPKEDILKDNKIFKKKIKEFMPIILEKYELYEQLQKNSKIDSLTGLDNRKSYDERMNLINDDETDIVYGIFDLFRLKYVNDHHGHETGDKYILETANILKRYFPKYYKKQDEHGKIEKHYTGTCVYRIGGDEFALITPEPLEVVETKVKLAREEIKMLDLGIDDNPHLDINYGIVAKEKEDKALDLSVKADELLREDKDRTYQETGLDRRK